MLSGTKSTFLLKHVLSSASGYMNHEKCHAPFNTPDTPTMQNMYVYLETLRLHRPPALLWLATIGSPALDLLVSAQTCTKRDINPWWCAESEALRNLYEIQLVHVEHGPQAVRCICLEIGSVTILRRLVEVVVLGDESFQL